MEEHPVARYYINNREIDVYGFNAKNEDLTRFENFDLFEDGQCLNCGDVFYSLPSFKTVVKYLRKNSL